MKMPSVLVVTVYVLVIWTDNAYAYIDPGAGSMILQALLAALIGVGVFVRQVRLAVTSFFKRLVGKASEKNGDE